MVFSKKGLHRNLVTAFGNLLLFCPKLPDFVQIFYVAAQKILVLLKYSFVTVRKVIIFPKF